MFSIKPKKETNKDYLNISNNNNENNSVLSIDLKTINFENIAVELALNVLQLKHNEYYNMNQTEIIQYYNHKMKLTNNINNILALKIILKYKLKGLDIKINKMNGIMVSGPEIQNNLSKNTKKTEKSTTELKIDSIINNSQEDFKIQQVQQNNFKIIQKNITQNFNKNIVEIPKYSYNFNNAISNNSTNINPYVNTMSNNNNISNDNFNVNNNSNQSNQIAQFNQLTQFNLQNSMSKSILNNNFNSNEKINDMAVITSSEFDIDSIINSYTQKKNSGLVK